MAIIESETKTTHSLNTETTKGDFSMLAPYVLAKNMFDEVFDSAFSNRNVGGMMNTDIKETEQGYELVIDLPGVQKENLSAELKDGYLCISATVGHSNDGDTQNEKYLRRERFAGSFRRSFYVGDRIRQEDIRAKFEDGILHLFFPKEINTPQIESKHLIAIEG